jgi:Asp/Glu/hydantoin racemase
MPRIAVLHTSFVFVNVEPVLNDLFRELLPDVGIIHAVDSDLLATVRREGRISPGSAGRMVHLAQAAELAGVDVIFSACSSLGPAIDRAREVVSVPIIKIDDAMARKAVRLGSRIGVMATVPTTLDPTIDLIQDQAARAGTTVTTFPFLCEGAFELLMSGDRAGHDALVLDGAKALAPQVDLIVLAQASMSRLAPVLSQATGMEVLSSPRLAVEDLRELLAEMDHQVGKKGGAAQPM